jgi:hypothetical protein
MVFYTHQFSFHYYQCIHMQYIPIIYLNHIQQLEDYHYLNQEQYIELYFMHLFFHDSYSTSHEDVHKMVDNSNPYHDKRHFIKQHATKSLKEVDDCHWLRLMCCDCIGMNGNNLIHVHHQLLKLNYMFFLLSAFYE